MIDDIWLQYDRRYKLKIGVKVKATRLAAPWSGVARLSD